MGRRQAGPGTRQGGRSGFPGGGGPLPGARVRWERLDSARVLLPRQGAMRTEGLVYADERMMRESVDEAPLRQVANVACLPGIVGRSIAMPDIHWGYGFPIGGVAAFDATEGVVSPGGVGYDINCGVRLLRTDLRMADVRARVPDLVAAMFTRVPTGVGSHQRDLSLSRPELAEVGRKGAAWAVERGFGDPGDLAVLEEGGCIQGADPEAVSDHAEERGRRQLGTLGSGNHFAEIGVIDLVEDPVAAAAFGLFEGGVVVTIHTGSRGFGHQVCTDYIPVMDGAARKAGIELPDRQLACAPLSSPEGRRYFSAMAAAANFAFANRQIIAAEVREAFESVLGRGWRQLGLQVVYDVAHNIAKFEEHVVDGRRRRVCVHRKGATRALPAGDPRVPKAYRDVGQPVLVPGDMGRASWVLAGMPASLAETFGSSCHGAGRLLSRHAAVGRGRGRDIRAELKALGISVMAAGGETLSEEMPEAYKDVGDVVDVVQLAGIARKVARIRPVGVIKG